MSYELNYTQLATFKFSTNVFVVTFHSDTGPTTAVAAPVVTVVGFSLITIVPFQPIGPGVKVFVVLSKLLKTAVFVNEVVLQSLLLVKSAAKTPPAKNSAIQHIFKNKNFAKVGKAQGALLGREDKVGSGDGSADGGLLANFDGVVDGNEENIALGLGVGIILGAMITAGA